MTKNQARRVMVQRARWLKHCYQLNASAGVGMLPERARTAYLTEGAWRVPVWASPKYW